MRNPSTVVFGLLCGTVVMFSADRPTGDRIAEAGKSLDQARVRRFSERPPSFSLLIFDRDVVSDIPRLFEDLQFKVLAKSKTTSNYSEFSKKLSDSEVSEDKGISQFAVYIVENRTVVAGPVEVIFLHTNAIVSFCSEKKTTAHVVDWERVSESVLLASFASDGLKTFAVFSQDKATVELINPIPMLQKKPNYKGLMETVMKEGLPVKEAIGKDKVEVTLLKLRWLGETP